MDIVISNSYRTHVKYPAVCIFFRPESYDHKRYRHEPVEPGGVLRVPKSQGAEVGALVLMLKTAAPLCQDLSSSTNFSQAPRSETWNNSIQPPDQISEAPAVQDATSSRVASSGLVFSKTTADALEELKGYKDMKNVLIKQGLRSQTSTNLASAAEVSCRGTTG
ncbi:Autophagy-related protein 13b [Vitis vinifera]|uniref:Autophagy-related protein 13b n=1 Tax=Vitis vinifera TaxID=29760 RepID=A0A438D1B7_VITVI|nr:Autophagy-related protein 13b [Vitis vinifera]